jgi:hypothetical protein
VYSKIPKILTLNEIHGCQEIAEAAVAKVFNQEIVADGEWSWSWSWLVTVVCFERVHCSPWLLLDHSNFISLQSFEPPNQELPAARLYPYYSKLLVSLFCLKLYHFVI